MKKWFLNMLVVGVLGTFAVSCSDEYDGLSQELDSNKAQVVFSVAMDTPSTRSRATDTWGDDFTPSAPGDEYDNRIDLEQFIIKIESEGKTYPITDVIKWKEKDSEVNEYKFVGVVQGMTSSVTLENVKINVYANMGSNPDADFGTMTFGQDAENIPMWGVLTADKLEFAPGKRTELPTTISLLRAMAKFQVGISDAMIDKGYALTAASLNKFNPIGNCMPSGYATADNTTAMGQESVLNENTTGQVEATALPVAETGKSYVVYLPEISNTSDSELKMLLTFIKGDTERIETEVSVKDYSADNTGLLNIVRNHWYKYVISDIVNGEPVVEYSTVEWINKEIEVGGEGFLVLNKDVIEIYNANIDADQLKFSSSSPIKSIELKDIYKHENNGTFKEGAGDGVSAYYISKFGVLTQLGTDPGFDFEGKDASLANEEQILSAISATYENGQLNGGITIHSPYIAHETYGNSHYDTPRYLEFEVTNEQDLKATFRVVQYPPVIITHIEGFFSYRDDFTRKDGEEPAYWTNYMGPGSITTVGLCLVHEHDWTEEVNQPEEWWNTRQSDRSYTWLDDSNYSWLPKNNSCPYVGKDDEVWEEVRYAMIAHTVLYKNASGKETSGFYTGGYRPSVHPTKMFLRERYKALPGSDEANINNKGLAIGDYYEKEVIIDGIPTKRTFRKHYTWDIQTIFWSKYVSKVYSEDGYNNASTPGRRLKGQADIISITDNYSTPEAPATKFADYSNGRLWRNHRMYHIKTTVPAAGNLLGFPALVDDENHPTDNTDRGTTANTPENARLVSPSLMLASQLGETNYNYIITECQKYGYKFPGLSQFYEFAKKHCREYVESSYEDVNKNGSYDEGIDNLAQYHDWRLPTKAEIEMIIGYQNNSRAMDQVLLGEHFICVTGNPGEGDDEEFWVSSEVPGYKISAAEDLDGIAYDNWGYYIRCVRDVK